MSGIALEMRGITKNFGSNHVLKGVNLEAHSGEILALIGANGAGKSTLMNILCGLFQADDGQILIEGKEVRFSHPMDAIQAGIAFVQQEMTLMPTMSIMDNMFLNTFPTKCGFIQYGDIKEKCRESLKRLGCGYSPETLVGSLGAGDRQLVQISRALLCDPKIIIFDEATSSLTEPEKEKLFGVIEQLKKSGVCIIYITHMMDEIFSLCQKVMVLRDGIRAGHGLVSETKHDDLVQMMIGDKASELNTHAKKPGNCSERVLMKVENMSRYGVIDHISFELHAGEVVGIWGLMGAGRTETIRCAAGIDPIDEGDIYIADKDGQLKKVKSANVIKHVALITEDRRVDGLALSMSVKENMTSANIRNLTGISKLFIDGKRERQVVEEQVKKLEIKVADIDLPISSLSGGNQQKVILGRWIQKDLDVYIFDEPTRGLDIGAKADVIREINALAAAGAAVLVINSDIDELISVSHRYLVMYHGRITKELPADATKTELMAAAMDLQIEGVHI
ncbi:MAG: sugar ABC transporter ATP-binding protein [Clostridiales bacterium]|nr:sugar ABC transporter ATP-binding protein [Clostridiales bacterium]